MNGEIYHETIHRDPLIPFRIDWVKRRMQEVLNFSGMFSHTLKIEAR